PLLDEREEAGELIDRTLACLNPDDETIRNWIKGAENYWNYEQKYGPQRARRQFAGRGRSIQATRPLETVMMDHTRLDVWAVILDEYGKPILVERPWLTVAIDCYSRMVLGAVFTFEPPSVNSVMECLRQVVRRKDFLIQRYGTHKHATDGYGKPLTVIVDNGWEFVGSSFKSSCQAANIDVIWAPVKIPMFKAYVERLFGTLNEGIWHRLEGGIPLTPTDRALLDLDPQADAVHERSMIEQFFWQFVTTIYHVEPHSGIGMAPECGGERASRPKRARSATTSPFSTS
ncbi:MAG: transposase family protein, partial [Phyllobacteriaceae bacterium]|nr:transposase family protein [Phyllobacteriaceae bacterium]